jgi:hypothetical protein
MLKGEKFVLKDAAKSIGRVESTTGFCGCCSTLNGVIMPMHIFPNFNPTTTVTVKFCIPGNVLDGIKEQIVTTEVPFSSGVQIDSDVIWFNYKAVGLKPGDVPCLKVHSINDDNIGDEFCFLTYADFPALCAGESSLSLGTVKSLSLVRHDTSSATFDSKEVRGVYSSRGGDCGCPMLDKSGKLIGMHVATDGSTNCFLGYQTVWNTRLQGAVFCRPPSQSDPVGNGGTPSI